MEFEPNQHQLSLLSSRLLTMSRHPKCIKGVLVFRAQVQWLKLESFKRDNKDTTP